MPNLFLLPGMLCDERLWQPQADALPPEWHITMPDITTHDALEGSADALYPSLPETFFLGGMSMGGYLSLALVRLLHEKSELHRLEGLMLVATSAGLDSEEELESRKGFIKLAQLGKFKGMSLPMMPHIIHPSRVENTKITDLILAMAEDIGVEGFIRQETAVINRRDQHDILKYITCPTLILCGDSDLRTPPPCSHAMKKAIPHAELHILERCGHVPPLEKPEVTTRLMKTFLSDLAEQVI